jgi:hypothetical protein
MTEFITKKKFFTPDNYDSEYYLLRLFVKQQFNAFSPFSIA